MNLRNPRETFFFMQHFSFALMFNLCQNKVPLYFKMSSVFTPQRYHRESITLFSGITVHIQLTILVSLFFEPDCIFFFKEEHHSNLEILTLIKWGSSFKFYNVVFSIMKTYSYSLNRFLYSVKTFLEEFKNLILIITVYKKAKSFKRKSTM